MKLGKKIAAVATALALGLGGAVAVAAPASAHTGGVTGVASCEADGTYTIEWTYNANYVPNGVEAETKAMTTSSGSLAPIDGVNKGGQIFLSVWSDHQVNVPGAPVKTGNWSAKFKTVGIPGSFVGDVTTMVQTDWKNGPSEDPVGKVKVDGTCKPPVVVPPKPADTVVSVPTESVNCESKVVTISTVTTTTGTRLENNVWVPTEPVVSAPVITTRPATEQECPTTPPPPTNTCPGVISGDTSTNLNDLWQNIDTRATGHQEYVEGGLRVWTEGSTSTDKVSEGRAVSFPLKNTGVVSIDYDATIGNVAPGVNLFVTFAAGQTGTLVFEPTYADGSPLYGQDAWLTNGSSAAVKANAPVIGGGNGSQWHGTVDQWLTKYPDAQVTGIAYSAGSGVYLDGVIHSINVGCTTFYFDFAEEPVVVPEQPEETVVVTETSDKDCDAKTVTTTTTTTTSGRTVYNEETNTWDPIEDLVVVTSSEHPTTAEECPVTTTPTPTPNPSVTSTPVPAADGPDELAKTGYEGASLMPVFWVVLGVVVLGAAFLIGSFFWRRKHPVDATEV